MGKVLSLLLALTLAGCGAARANKLTTVPVGAEAPKFWTHCAEVLDAQTPKDWQAFRCYDVTGQAWMFQIRQEAQ